MRTRKLAVFGMLGALTLTSVLFDACRQRQSGTIVSSAPDAHTGDDSQVVSITASKFHFTPDHITLTRGQPVTLQLTSTDVTHGFMIRALKIDTDIKPGKTTAVTVTPATAGTFKAICDHYCGAGHGGMKMTIVVHDAAAKASSQKLASANAVPG